MQLEGGKHLSPCPRPLFVQLVSFYVTVYVCWGQHGQSGKETHIISPWFYSLFLQTVQFCFLVYEYVLGLCMYVYMCLKSCTYMVFKGVYRRNP